MKKKKNIKIVFIFLVLIILIYIYLFYTYYNRINSAVLIVDWIQEFKDENIENLSISMDKIEPEINSIHEFSEKNQLNIFYSVDTRMLKDMDNPLASILVDIKLNNIENIYLKEEFDASSNPEFVERLSKENIKQIYLIGIVSNYCILETAKGLKEKGFKVYIIKEGIAAHPNDDIEEHLRILSSYSKIISKRLFFIKLFNPFSFFS